MFWTLPSFELQVGVERVVRSRVADPLGGRTQLVGEVLLDGGLQGAEPLEAELGGETHHRRRARSGSLGEVGDRAERDELRIGQHDLGDAPLGGRQTRTGSADPIRHFHGRGS